MSASGHANWIWGKMVLKILSHFPIWVALDTSDRILIPIVPNYIWTITLNLNFAFVCSYVNL